MQIGEVKVDPAYVGTVNVVGDALCFGLVYRPNTTQVAFLWLVGPRTSVEAVWARLLNSRAAPIWMNLAGTTKNVMLSYSPLLERYQTALPIGQDSLALVVDDDDLDVKGRQREGDHRSPYLYLLTDVESGQPVPACLLAVVKRISKAPLYLDWARSGELLALAQAERLALPCIGYGKVGLVALLRDADRWDAMLSSAKKGGGLKLPAHADEHIGRADAARS